MNNILDNFTPEFTSLWSFPERGTWATHNPKYKGNFAPQIARNIILRYSNEGDTILDPMVGSGTTLIETRLLNRKGIGIDINENAIKLTLSNLKFEGNYKHSQIVRKGDVRNLKSLKTASIDLILTHPPYLNIIKYSTDTEGDLSLISNIEHFCDEFEKAIIEFYRVLKENSYCAILIGDTRKNCHYIPLAYHIMNRFLKNGFLLKEDIIKAQHNCNSTAYWRSQAQKYNIYLIMHEHLFVFRKPFKNENINKFKFSKL